MRFLKNLWKKKIKVGPYFGATSFELNNFFCGIGESEIIAHSIIIRKYPFKPSSIYPSKEISYSAIDEIHVEAYPPTLKIGEELIFIKRASIDQLKTFAERNGLQLVRRSANWNFITEPFLDTELDDQQREATARILKANGFGKEEIVGIRKEIGEQLYKYNFDTMLWEWGILGLTDVLAAMRPKLSEEEFNLFYWRAMEIEQRS